MFETIWHYSQGPKQAHFSFKNYNPCEQRERTQFNAPANRKHMNGKSLILKASPDKASRAKFAYAYKYIYKHENMQAKKKVW